MIRFFTPLIAILLVAANTSAADAKKVVLRWHGQSFFDLETSQGVRIAFDPHQIEAYGRISIPADLVLVSHFHDDHTQIQVVQPDDTKKPRVLTGLKPGTGRRPEWEIINEKLTIKNQDIRVRTVGTYHDTMQGMERGKNGIFIVEVDGLRIVHLGDLGHTLSKEQVEKIGPVDVLMIPVGGVYTLNGSEAKRVVAQLKPKMYIVPMHYGTKVFDEVLPVNEFLEDQKKDHVKIMKTNELVIMSDFKPMEPDIIVLHYAAK